MTPQCHLMGLTCLRHLEPHKTNHCIEYTKQKNLLTNDNDITPRVKQVMKLHAYKENALKCVLYTS